MNTPDRMRLLQDVYRIHAQMIAAEPLHCRSQCAWCCTSRVTVTTLEALMMIQSWEATGSDAAASWMGVVRLAAGRPRFQPATTINQFSALCAADADLPQDKDPPDHSLCLFLQDGLCTAYTSRPFACRAMVSLADCAGRQAADMPDFVLTINHILMQYIEALDGNGRTGNLIDILLLLSNPRQRACYEVGRPLQPAHGLLINRPISVLMAPPQHREKILPLLQALHRLQYDKPD